MYLHAHVRICVPASFLQCHRNVYISGESRINFLHVETRSYDCICMIMYVYMCHCGDAVLSGCAMTAHLYKWLF